MGWYSNTPANFGPMFGAKWVDDAGKSTIGTDPAWAKLLTWQKDLIDFYGYDNLVKFQAGLGDEFSASNAFEKGKLAMNVDGEWRTAFIADEAPDLHYGTAPVPVDDDNRRPLRRRLHDGQHRRHPQAAPSTPSTAGRC